MPLEQRASELIDRAAERGITLRMIGGVAIKARCPSATHRNYARDYGDIDLCASERDIGRLEGFFVAQGYEPWIPFNRLNAEISQRFENTDETTQIDVFLSRLRMCHELDFEKRLEFDERTLTLADLLLSKLQIVKMTEKDLKDIYALVNDHPLDPNPNGHDAIDVSRVAKVCGNDWGWYRTVRGNLEKATEEVGAIVDADHASTVTERLRQLADTIEEAPKSRRWRLRARVGERVRWYDVPEDPERGSDV